MKKQTIAVVLLGFLTSGVVLAADANGDIEELKKKMKDGFQLTFDALEAIESEKATKAELTEIQNYLDESFGRIGTYTADLDRHLEWLDTYLDDVDTGLERINGLDNRMNRIEKDVRRGLASQAALTGLFQPYKVGKVNVTAALGGYKSDTALAVGAGYRFNENFAAKAGVSVSTKGGSASYNVGVNYEF